MKTIDFSRSFLTFRIDTLKKPPTTVTHRPPYSLNNARIQLDCVCEIVEKSTGRSQRFVQGVDCKTEQVGVPRDVWLVPNADFVPIVSVDQYLTIKTYSHIGAEQGVLLFGRNQPQSDRQSGRTADAFDTLRIHIHEVAGEWLDKPVEMIAATYAHHPLTATTEFENDRYQVSLCYPIKTFNVNERDDVYQTDTGPVLFPDLTCEPDELITGLQLAFAAFNSPDWIEFIVRVPTEIPGSPAARVHHYSRSVRLEGVRNRIAVIR